MVRLDWFPGYMDWERRIYTWEIRYADVREARSFAQCVSIPSNMKNPPLVWGSLRLAPISHLLAPEREQNFP